MSILKKIFSYISILLPNVLIVFIGFMFGAMLVIYMHAKEHRTRVDGITLHFKKLNDDVLRLIGPGKLVEPNTLYYISKDLKDTYIDTDLRTTYISKNSKYMYIDTDLRTTSTKFYKSISPFDAPKINMLREHAITLYDRLSYARHSMSETERVKYTSELLSLCADTIFEYNKQDMMSIDDQATDYAKGMLY